MEKELLTNLSPEDFRKLVERLNWETSQKYFYYYLVNLSTPMLFQIHEFIEDEILVREEEGSTYDGVRK